MLKIETMAEPLHGPFWPTTGRVLRNLADGFNRCGYSMTDAARVVGLGSHSPVSKMLHGHTPLPMHYVIAWREWLGAPQGWPIESWDDALRTRDMLRTLGAESGQGTGHRGPGIKPRRGNR